MTVQWISEHGRSALARAVASDLDVAESALAGLAEPRLRSGGWDVIVVEATAGGGPPEDLVAALRQTDEYARIVVVGGSHDCSVSLAKAGADVVIDGGRPLGEIRSAVAGTGAARVAAHEPWRASIVGDSRAMQVICDVIRLIGPRRCTVLVSGPTGTGKELVARALHAAGPRAAGPFVAVNCASLPKDLLEAEMFGHVKGAFTGATSARPGRFEMAHKGTLFLDEIGEMPLELQPKLLRALQEREFQRLGSSETVRVDVRVVAASNVDLAAAVREGSFREDLYYRLNVVPIRLPALSERTGDIPALVERFLRDVCMEEDLPPKRADDSALQALARRSWPGNVRELQNVVARAALLSGDRVELTGADFPFSPAGASQAEARPLLRVDLPYEGLDFDAEVNRFELHLLEQALRRANGNKKKAADMLRLKRTTLAAKLKNFEALAVTA